MNKRVFVIAALLVAFLAEFPVTYAESASLLKIEHPDFSQFEVGVRARMETVARAVKIARDREPRDDAALSRAYGNLGMLYHAYSLYDPAEAGYRNAHALRPDETAWIYLLAYLLHGEGQFDRSIELYNRSLALDSGFLPARIHLAQAYFTTDRLDDAEREFAASSEREPRSAAALYGLGGIALRRQENEAAIEFYRRALDIEPGATQIHYNLAQAYRKTGDREAAKRHLEIRGTVKPSVHDPVLALMQAQKVTSQEYLKEGLTAYEEGRYADAVTAHELALTLQPDDPKTHLTLAWVMELAGDERDAMQHVDIALKLDPDYAQAHFSKGAMLEESGDDDAALAHYRQAVAGAPDSYPPRLLLANALMRDGAFAEAAEQYNVLAADQTGDVILFFRLALAQQRSGNCLAAVATISTALEEQQGSSTLMQTYARLVSSCPEADDATIKNSFVVAQRLLQGLRNMDSGETMAMAAAANTQFEQAIGLQEQIVRQLRSQNRSADFAQKNLDAYRDNRLASEPWPADADVYLPRRVNLRDRMALAGIGT